MPSSPPRRSPVVEAACRDCGRPTQVFTYGKPPVGFGEAPRCAKCRQAGARTRREQKMALEVERVLGGKS